MSIAAQNEASGASRYDVVVIGGGINGTSAARELTAAGYKVLLAEMSDLANGASSRSSRILHCGLRYFETAQPVRTFLASPRRLVGAAGMARAAMQARSELSASRPETCRPFTMCFPVYRGDAVGGWHLDLGFRLLAGLGPARPSLDYRRVARDFDRHVPFAGDLRDRAHLRSIATYREYIIDSPDRLCVDAALEAERGGAALRLHTRATIAGRGIAGGWRLHLSGPDGVEAVEAQVVLNLAGTWSDAVVAGISPEPQAPLVTGTKGAHIVVRLPPRYAGHGIACLNRRGLPFYCLPLGGDLFCFGPTETPYEGDAADAVATDEDVAFLLGEANFLLPGLGLRRSDVVFTWAGVRPLGYDSRQPLGRRVRTIHDLAGRGLPGIFAMTAGPVMSHLSAGRELRAAVGRVLPPSGAPVARPRTAPSPDPASEVDRLRRAVVAEHARDLEGILYTRTGLAWGCLLDRRTVAAAAQSVSDLLGWSPGEVATQVERFMERQEFRFGRRAADGVSSARMEVET